MQRRRFKHILSFPDRLAEEAERLRADAEKLPHGHERDGGRAACGALERSAASATPVPSR